MGEGALNAAFLPIITNAKFALLTLKRNSDIALENPQHNRRAFCIPVPITTLLGFTAQLHAKMKFLKIKM